MALRVPRAGSGDVDRLLREARMMAQVTHPNVVAVYEVGTDDVPYVVMERVHGTDLAARRADGPSRSSTAARTKCGRSRQGDSHEDRRGLPRRSLFRDHGNPSSCLSRARRAHDPFLRMLGQMYKCDVHGSQSIAVCCSHVGDAIEANRLERVHLVANRWGEIQYVCEACQAQAEGLLAASVEDPSSDGFVEPVEPCCFAHVCEWYRGTEQGDLEDAIVHFYAQRSRTPRVIKCPDHGLITTHTCCTHIGAAVAAARFERLHIFAAPGNVRYLVCEPCRAQAERLLAASEPKGELQLDPLLEAYCDVHVADWYKVTGQGDLASDIGQTLVLPDET